jgi:branched-chain amino acid transport system ATP-binding protein
MALLSAERIVVQFGGLRALSDAQVEVEKGRVTGLIGPNGAGKTTLFNVITGLQPPTTGRVLLDGRDITGKSPYRRARLGIARTFQKLEAFTSLSARNNIRVAAEQRKAWDRSGFDPGRVTDELLERIGLVDVAEYMVGVLPTGTARLVELARALATNPRVLLLDEPSSGLNEEETDEMARILRELVGDGLAVLLVEHDMKFVMGTCEYIHVLEFGQIIATGTPSEIQDDPAVQAAYLGTKAEGAA